MSHQYSWMVFSIENVHFKCVYLLKVQFLEVQNHMDKISQNCHLYVMGSMELWGLEMSSTCD